VRWTAAENALLRAQAAGTISYTELCAQLPARTWDAIETQRRALGLTRQPQAIYYRVVDDAREMVAEGYSSTTEWLQSLVRRCRFVSNLSDSICTPLNGRGLSPSPTNAGFTLPHK
jgi:hypothetical protein